MKPDLRVIQGQDKAVLPGQRALFPEAVGPEQGGLFD
jgi:hypothetical protein